MISISIPQTRFDNIKNWLSRLNLERLVLALALIAAVSATAYFYHKGWLIAYGDAESHLNIAKRVVSSLTPGFAQLGGIWLPLPHIFMIPFVYFDPLWRTGLAGSIVSGSAFVVSSLMLYKLTYIVTKNKLASFVTVLVFITNPNILYLQSTAMTELPLIVFFVLSSYFFVKFIQNPKDNLSLILASFFGFCATLSRYDGWFLVVFEAGVVALTFLPWQKFPWPPKNIWAKWNRERFRTMQGKLILFATPAFFGILIWLMWGLLILGDPFYFTHSQFSAKSQQAAWLARGELPAYKNLVMAVYYYFVTSMSNIGLFIFAIALIGLILFIVSKRKVDRNHLFILIILLVPFVFNVTTLFLGQSVIFIPHITPISYEWRLFNVRYGVMMVPAAAFLAGYLFYRTRTVGRALIIFFLIAQLGLYGIGYSKAISLADGTVGLSSGSAKIPDAQGWMNTHYDGGLVLVDDFARTLSIVRTKIPMQDIIYVGNKPYWPDSLKEPEKYATWIVMQHNDEVWRNIYDNQPIQDRMYKYFQKVYTSPDILIFKRNPDVPAGS